jgi:hypothetical protein
MFWVKPISVSGVNFVKTNGVGSPNLKIIDNITFLQADSVLWTFFDYNKVQRTESACPKTSGFVENRNLSYFLRFGEPTPIWPRIVPLANRWNLLREDKLFPIREVNFIFLIKKGSRFYEFAFKNRRRRFFVTNGQTINFIRVYWRRSLSIRC